MANCISPITLKGKNGLPPHSVPCGRCHRCLINKKDSWAFRIWQEWKHANTANFITLTYDNESVPLTDQGILTLDKQALHQYIKKLKKRNDYLLSTKYIDLNANDWRLRHFACGEYGEEYGRPHYHILLFNLLPDIIPKLGYIWKEGTTQIEENMGLGAIEYVSKYMIKREIDKDDESKTKPFTITSRNPYIGHQYEKESNKKWHLENRSLRVTNMNGKHMTLPRIYREKWFKYRPEKGGDLEYKPGQKLILDILQSETSEKALIKSKKQREKWINEGLNPEKMEIEAIEREIHNINNLKTYKHEHF